MVRLTNPPASKRQKRSKLVVRCLARVTVTVGGFNRSMTAYQERWTFSVNITTKKFHD